MRTSCRPEMAFLAVPDTVSEKRGFPIPSLFNNLPLLNNAGTSLYRISVRLSGRTRTRRPLPCWITIAATGFLLIALPALGPALLAAEPGESNTEKAPTLASPQTVQPPPTKNDPGEQPDQFTPTEKIKADNVVSFPVDI